MIEVSTDDVHQIVEVKWVKENEKHKFYYCWVLESCQCPGCFNQSSQQRQVEASRRKATISRHEVKEESLHLTICLDQEAKNVHEIIFPTQWLLQRGRRFVRPNVRLGYSPSRVSMLPPTLWNKQHSAPLPEKFSFEEIVSLPNTQIKFTESLEVFGLVLVKGVPQVAGEIEKFGRLIAGFVQPTHYGTTFDVVALPNPNNQAYTSRKLALHTDLPVRQNPPEIQMLHCIKQAENGGKSTFSDGFLAAKILQKQFPDAFELLTTTLVRFVDYSSNFHYEGRKVTIEISPGVENDGVQEVTAINLNDVVRDSVLELPVEEHERFYEAYCLFKEIIEEGSISFRLTEGDLICFDNRRVLHGRQQFVATGETSRFLQGTYIAWEDLLSVKNTLLNSN